MNLTDYDLESVPKTWSLMYIPKKSGGKRELHVPNDRLKEVQEALLDYFYELWWTGKVRISSVAHGFIPNRSCATAVMRHERDAALMFCCDVEGFFDNITEEQALMRLLDAGVVKDLARKMMACCAYEGRMPQGAPTSPFLTNLVMFDVDNQIAAYAKKHGFLYTRYADDMQFSKLKVPAVVMKDIRRAENGLPFEHDYIPPDGEEYKIDLNKEEDPNDPDAPTQEEKQEEAKRRSKNPYLWFLYGVEKILTESLGLHLNHEKDHIIFKGSNCKPHILGICIRHDGRGYNAIKKMRYNTRARVFNLYHKVFDSQNGQTTYDDLKEWASISGSIQYMDYIRSLSDPECNDVDPKIQTKYYCKLEEIFGGQTLSAFA